MESKICIRCGVEYFRGATEPVKVWGRREYCGRDCAKFCRITHGNARIMTSGLTPTYNSWRGMLKRVRGTGSERDRRVYAGVTMDSRWLKFENFLEDMGERPRGTSLDRINNARTYSKETCRWSTNAEQSRNRTDNVFIEFAGERLCISDWAKRLGASQSLIRDRLRAGWPVDKALTMPPIGRGKCSHGGFRRYLELNG